MDATGKVCERIDGKPAGDAMKLKRVNAYLICEPHDMCEESYDVFVDDELAARLAVYAELLAAAKTVVEWWDSPHTYYGHGDPYYGYGKIERLRDAIAKAEGKVTP